MDCIEFDKLAMKYLDKKVTSDEIIELEKHKQECRECRESFEIIEIAIMELEKEDEIDINVNINFTSDVMKKVNAYERQQETKETYIEIVFYAVSLCLFLGTVSLWNYIFQNVNLVSIVREIKLFIKAIFSLVESFGVISAINHIAEQINSFLPILFICTGIYVLYNMTSTQKSTK